MDAEIRYLNWDFHGWIWLTDAGSLNINSTPQGGAGKSVRIDIIFGN